MAANFICLRRHRNHGPIDLDEPNENDGNVSTLPWFEARDGEEDLKANFANKQPKCCVHKAED